MTNKLGGPSAGKTNRREFSRKKKKSDSPLLGGGRRWGIFRPLLDLPYLSLSREKWFTPLHKNIWGKKIREEDIWGLKNHFKHFFHPAQIINGSSLGLSLCTSNTNMLIFTDHPPGKMILVLGL